MKDVNEVVLQRKEEMTLKGPVVLVISGDADSADLMAVELLEAGYDVNVAGSLTTAFTLARELNPAVVIMDLALLDGEGKEVIVRLSRAGIPVMVVTEKRDVDSMVSLLNMGAVDYLAGPVDMQELLARVAVQVRLRFSASGPSALVVGELTLDVDGYQLLVGQQSVSLSALEQRLLGVLMREPGRLFLYKELRNRVWGPEGVNQDALSRHMSSLRRKLQAEKADGYLVTVRGFGYVIRKPVCAL